MSSLLVDTRSMSRRVAANETHPSPAPVASLLPLKSHRLHSPGFASLFTDDVAGFIFNPAAEPEVSSSRSRSANPKNRTRSHSASARIAA
jgi:hypothetical protein